MSGPTNRTRYCRLPMGDIAVAAGRSAFYNGEIG
jgi:hypothetical protein